MTIRRKILLIMAISLVGMIAIFCRSLWDLIFALAGASILFAALIYLLLDRFVVDRLLRFQRGIDAITIGEAPIRRVEVDGADEIASIGRSLNGLLDRIESDRTAMGRLQTRLLQAEKLETIGRLAGAVAHEFNNLLTGLVVSSARLRERIGAVERQRCLDEIDDVVRKAAHLIDQLLDTSGGRPPKLERVDLNATIQDLETTLRGMFHETIALDLRPAPDSYRIEVDPERLRRAILALAVRAASVQPMEGRVIFETRDVEIVSTGADRCQIGVLVSGRYARLRVGDQGPSLSPDETNRLFDPTSRVGDVAHDLGLGLPSVARFVQESGGGIRVASRDGFGTLISLYLPMPAEEPLAAPAPVSGAENAESVSDGVILLVDDEDGIRRSLTRFLTSRGFAVTAAANGDEALARARTMERIDLLLTDVVMPMMSGFELAERLRELRPALAVLYVSGYVEYRADQGKVLTEENFLAKPFEPEELLARVRRRLVRARKKEEA